MAQTGVAALSLFNWPAGTDKTQHKLVLEGEIAISPSEGSFAITSYQVATDVLTLQVVNDLAGTEDIVISGFSGGNAFINGSYTLTSATGTTMVMNLTHADAGPTTAAGTATLVPEYVDGGLPLIYTFTNAQGNAVQVPLGSGAVPNWIEAYSASGGAYNYKFDQTVSPNTLRIYNGATELSDADAIVADTIYYRAEFNYGMGGSGY